MLKRYPKRLFWILQTTGWCGYALLNFLQGIAHDRTVFYIYPTLGYAAAGFLITLGLRGLYRRVWRRSLPAVAVVAALGTFVAAAAFDASKTLIFMQLYPDFWWQPSRWTQYFSNLALSIYIMLAWTGLYFGMKYYRTAQKQTELALKANATAHQAQLEMLRYQLNPHFLFNTLNAISTLTLEERLGEANQMVTRLSTFLRHTLDQDPREMVTLERELEAINLYLEIEKIRFEERLRVNFEVSDVATHALVPSLILQPLIENAIKFAVANREDGGTLDIRARVENSQLCLSVADDGPGAPKLVEADQAQRQGVGLVNTRERLSVLYGEAHSLELENVEPSGLRVRMSLPLTLAESVNEDPSATPDHPANQATVNRNE